MNFLLAIAITIIYVIAKMALHKETRPNVKDGVVVFLSSVVGIYAMEHIPIKTTKLTEVFTETPSF